MTALYVEMWREANPDGVVVYRDLDAEPLPHLNEASYLANVLDPKDHTAEHASAMSLTTTILDEVLEADTIVLGMGFYNFGTPSTVKAWVDRIVIPGVTIDHEGNGLLGGRTLVAVLAAGGGYGPGTPREGWDTREMWLRNIFGYVGLTDIVVVSAELTAARENPALIPLNLGDAEDRSIAEARAQIAELAGGVSLMR